MKKKFLLVLLLCFYTAVSFGQDTIFSIKKLEVLEVHRETESETSPLSESVTTTPSGLSTSPEIGETQGSLSVSSTGGAVYSVPIKVPPGIGGIEPEISLTYNSRGGNGLAGYGWNISGVSVISRIPATKYHDGYKGGVNLNDSDRFSFDGQRLLLKSGTYGQVGSEYQTENYSNTKIEFLAGVGTGTTYFKVSYPDGSVAYYGKSYYTSSPMDYAITYWENPQGIRINYEYAKLFNSLSIKKITYGSKGTSTPVNSIEFIYANRKRAEQTYVGGLRFVRNNILKEIKVIGNEVRFRNYHLTHDYNSQKVISPFR